MAAAAAFAGGGLWLSAIDLRTQRLPRRLIYATAGLVIALYLAAVVFGGGESRRLWWAIALGAVAAAVLSVMVVGSRGGLGDGDARLAGLIGVTLGYWGWPLVVIGISVGFMLGAIAALIAVLLRKATMRSSIPFGPFMVAGGIVGLLVLRTRYGR